MIKIPLVTKVGHESLAGLIINKEDTIMQAPQFVYLHGGGLSTSKERVYEVSDPILKNNINILSLILVVMETVGGI